MASMSIYLQNALMAHVFQGAAYPEPTVLAIALLTDAATANQDGSNIPEVAHEGGYERQILNPSETNWTLANGQINNLIKIEFPEATTGWGTVRGLAVLDDATWGAGNLLFYGTLSEQKLIEEGDILRLDVRDLAINLD